MGKSPSLLMGKNGVPAPSRQLRNPAGLWRWALLSAPEAAPLGPWQLGASQPACSSSGRWFSLWSASLWICPRESDKPDKPTPWAFASSSPPSAAQWRLWGGQACFSFQSSLFPLEFGPLPNGLELRRAWAQAGCLRTEGGGCCGGTQGDLTSLSWGRVDCAKSLELRPGLHSKPCIAASWQWDPGPCALGLCNGDCGPFSPGDLGGLNRQSW